MDDPGLSPAFLDRVAAAVRGHFGSDVGIAGCVKIPGQASNRTYYRLALSAAAVPTAVMVQLPDDPFASEEAATGEGVRELPFTSMQRFLAGRGLPVPAIYYDGAEEGFQLQEDLGETTMFRALQGAGPAETEAWYRRAVDLLVEFQEQTGRGDGGACLGHRRRFGYDLLRWELGHFKEWLLLDWAGARLSAGEDRALEAQLDALGSTLAGTTYVVAHRDFQSTNLMAHRGRLVMIDFQDALMAPPAYDLVALLRDSYVLLPSEMLARLLGHYFEHRVATVPFATYEELERQFAMQTVQRKLKDAGRFVYIDRRKGNPDYLKWIPTTLGYVVEALGRVPEFAELGEILKKHLP